MRLRVQLLAYRNADDREFQRGRERVLHFIEAEKVEFVDERPDVLVFLTGGSENAALRSVQHGRCYPLIAGQDANAYAAATEVKAYLQQQGIDAILLDADTDAIKPFLNRFISVHDGLHRLCGQTLGLIGTVSDWLAASQLVPARLQTALGIRLKEIPWTALPDFHSMAASDELMQTFSPASDLPLTPTAQVYALLRQCVRDYGLDALSVECFSLVMQHAVTACLPLAQFNAAGVPAGCEGDLVSTVGMMFAKAVTGCVPWMANVAKIAADRSLFAHCTIAPTLLRAYQITTHFETQKGTAIQGQFAADDITLLRLNQTLEAAFISPGRVLARPTHPAACRTQIEVKLPPAAIRYFREAPFGNHHLILPGDHLAALKLACRLAGMTVVEVVYDRHLA